MKIIMFTAVTLSALATAALADDRPLWDQQAGSPMDFIVHSQPAKYPHHLGTPAQGASGVVDKLVPVELRAPSVAEKAWMDRASGNESGK